MEVQKLERLTKILEGKRMENQKSIANIIDNLRGSSLDSEEGMQFQEALNHIKGSYTESGFFRMMYIMFLFGKIMGIRTQRACQKEKRIK